MKIRLTAAALCLLALPALAQDKPKEPAAADHGMAMGAAEMEAMKKAMSPGEPHKRLARMVGDWTYTNKMWMAPGQPPMDIDRHHARRDDPRRPLRPDHLEGQHDGHGLRGSRHGGLRQHRQAARQLLGGQHGNRHHVFDRYL